MERPGKNIGIYFLYIILVICWGSSFILMKHGLRYYSPPQVATIRQLSALIIFLPFAIIYIRKFPTDKIPYVILSGVLGMFLPAYLFCYAEVGLSSAVAGILNAFTPAFTVIAGAMFFKQSISRVQVVGLVVGFLGIIVLTLINAKGELVVNHYALFVVVATISYGFNINIVKVHLSGLNPFHITTVAVSFAGVFSLLYLLIAGGGQILPITPENKYPLLAAVTLGVFGTAVAQVLFNQIIKSSSAIFASSIVYALPIVALFWGFMDGEPFLIAQVIGLVAILSGIIIMRKSK